MEDQFDPDRLHSLVDAALSVSEPVAALPPPAQPPARPLPFTLMNMDLFAAVGEILIQHLGTLDAQVALDGLRDRIFGDYDRGDLPTLHALVSHCRRCGPAVNPTPTLPIGNLFDPDMVFVHDLPVSADWLATAFQPHANAAGIDAHRVAHTSIIRCRPIETDHSQIRTNCGRFLLGELQLLTPKLIVALGAPVLTRFFGENTTITRERGVVHWLGPWAILPTYSLNYLRHSDTAVEEFAADLRTAYTFAYGQRR